MPAKGLSGHPDMGPRCFMHVPKSGGTSVNLALLQAFPPGSVSEKRFDTSFFCEGFRDADGFPEELRPWVVHDDRDLESMARSKVVAGHFSLPTLERVAPPASIATTLREPRARLTSLYSFWRLGVSAQPDVWPPYFRHACRPPEEYLAEPAIAAATDNALCRMLLGEGETIPSRGFIASEDLPHVASAALEQLSKLGCVCILESGGASWRSLSAFFGAALHARRANASSELQQDVQQGAALTPAAADLLERRTAADAIVYEYAVTRLAPHRAPPVRQTSHQLMPDRRISARAWRSAPLTPFERRVHSQFGEDGVIEEILRRIRPPFQTCVEFGAANGDCSNTGLLMEQGWRALLIEANPEWFSQLEQRYASNPRVRTECARVTPDNINRLLARAGLVGFLGLISIDVDGNDLWIWRELSVARPAVVVIEYNGMLPGDRALVQPLLEEMWDESQYFGASLGALELVGRRKGYTLVHTTSEAVNAFFVADEFAHRFPSPEVVARHTPATTIRPDQRGRSYVELTDDA